MEIHAPVQVVKDPNQDIPENYLFSLTVLTTLFFLWGFIVSMNDVLIPKLMSVFTLLHWQAMLVQTAFFGAYFSISAAYFIISIIKGDPILKIGYQNGIVIGLGICAAGAFLFYPAAVNKSYGFFLTALFVIASGTAILQIAANPYVTILGTAQSASSRLNLTQAFNSLGTTIAPLLGGYLIFSQHNSDAASADSVKIPYLALSGILLLIGLIMKLVRLPVIKKSSIQIKGTGILKHPRLLLGVVCIFAYVGGEVTVGSNFISFIKLSEIGGFTASIAKNYLTFFWAGAMIGRFLGAVALSSMPEFRKYSAFTVIAVAVLLLIWAGYDLRTGLTMFALVCLNGLMFRQAKFLPENTLIFFAATIIMLLISVILFKGMPAVWCIVSIGFFNSIMFPTIFTLAVRGLGDYTSQGSSLLVMACVGGAAVPLLQGYFTDLTNNLQLSFFIPILCYVFILFYGLRSRSFRVQHIS